MRYAIRRSRFVLRVLPILAVALAASILPVHAQRPDASAQAQEAAPVADPFGRDTPRGTVTGFIEAARKGDIERAAQYLNARGQAAQTLARQLFDVLDARLPARLTRISDAPEGSGNSLTLNEEIVG